jgi:hypothetical protein
MRKQRGFGLQGMLVMGAVMGVMALGFLWYYKDSQATIKRQPGNYSRTSASNGSSASTDCRA